MEVMKEASRILSNTKASSSFILQKASASIGFLHLIPVGIRVHRVLGRFRSIPAVLIASIHICLIIMN